MGTAQVGICAAFCCAGHAKSACVSIHLIGLRGRKAGFTSWQVRTDVRTVLEALGLAESKQAAAEGLNLGY